MNPGDLRAVLGTDTLEVWDGEAWRDSTAFADPYLTQAYDEIRYLRQQLKLAREQIMRLLGAA